MSNASGLPIFGSIGAPSFLDLDPMLLPADGGVNRPDPTDVGNYLIEALGYAGANSAFTVPRLRVVCWLVVEAAKSGALTGLCYHYRGDFAKLAGRLRYEATQIAVAYDPAEYQKLARYVNLAADLLEAMTVFSTVRDPFLTE